MKKSLLQQFRGQRQASVALCLIAFSAFMAASAFAASPKDARHRKARTTHAQAPPTLQHATPAPGLPFDRILRPGLERQLARVRAAARPRAMSAATSNTSTLPNFGGFLAAAKYQAFDVLDQDNSPLSVFAAGDFNKDGKPDLVTVQASGIVNVLLNQGGGRFGSPISTLTDNANVGGAIQAMAIDLNKDGYADLVLIDEINNSVDVLLGKGDGTFGAPQFFTASSNEIASMAAADLNGDGLPDLVVVSSTLNFQPDGSITTTVELDTLLNDGHGGFLSPTGSLQQVFILTDEYDTLWGRSVVLADVNGDGILDATLETRHWLEVPTALEDSEHVIMTFPGSGGGVFAPHNDGDNVIVPSESTFNIGYPLVANLNVVDLNHDGIKDLVFSYQDYNIWVALGNGDGSYQAYYNVGAYQAYPTDLVTADINGNGAPELIDAEPGYLGIYPNRGNGTFDTTTIPYYGSGFGQFSVLAVADFTSDGTPDVALMNSDEGSVTIFAGVPTPPPAFSAGNLFNPQMGYVSRVTGQAVLDTNRDGNDDVVLFNSGAILNYPGLLTALGDGKGNFVYKNTLPGYAPTIEDFIDQEKGDFNGDGLDDLVLHTPVGVSLLLSNGDGSFTAKPLTLPSFSCITGKSAIGDVNGDGKLDLVIAYGGDVANPGCNSGTTPSGVFVLFGNGDGTFQPAKYVAVGEEVYEPVLLDTNHDGKLDLIISDVVFDLLAQSIPATFNTFLLLGNGDGTFQSPTNLLPNKINAHTMTADINGDGKTDLVVLTQGNVDAEGDLDSTTAGVLPMLANGDGTYSIQPLFLPGFFSASGLLTDINGDGKPDLVLNEFTSYDFTDSAVGGVAALGNGDGTFTAAGNFEGGYSSSLILQGDFLKDGAPDTVFVSGESGSTLIFNQGGTGVTATANPAAIQEGQSVEINVVVKGAITGRPQPTGTITLVEGSAAVGTGTLSNGSTTITVNGLAVGTDNIAVVYGGDTNFNVNSATSVSVQVSPVPPPPPPPPPAAVTVTASASSLNLTVGQTGTITFTVAANESFTGNVSFAVNGAPAGMSVSIAPVQVALAPEQTATSVLVVSTTSPKSELQWPLAAGGGASLAGLLLLVIPRRLRRRISSMAIVGFIALAGVLALNGCGGGSSVQTAPKGTTTLTVAALPDGLSRQTISVAVTVQ
jgi:Bacterial Ig-like domain (group 3)/FG-GAP-like repeat